jgi:hypothetical protein
MAKRSKILTPQQKLAVAALISCHTIKAAAGKVKVDERTLRRWMAQPHFAAALEAEEKDLTGGMLRRLAIVGSFAVEALARNLYDESGSVRNGAAVAVLNQLSRVRQEQEMEERLKAVEELLAKRGKP